MDTSDEQRYWLEREFINDLLKQLPIHVFWKNKDGVYLGCNDTFANSIGFTSPEQIIGKTDYDLPTTKEESNEYREDDRRVMESRIPKLNFEESQTLPNGKKIILLTSKVPLLDKKDNVVGVLGIYIDITERKLMEKELRIAKEKAEAANKTKTAFIANMSHDIKTPISGIISIAEILEKKITDHIQRDYAHNIYKSGKQLLALFNDILGVISTDENYEESVKNETFNLLDRISHLEELFSLNSKLANISFGIAIDPHLPRYIISDRTKIDRILLNLLSNSLKFTECGYTKLDVKLLSKNKNQATIQFTVSDSGIGIPKDKINFVFDRFYRINPSYEGKYVGHGIGLFIAKKFVTLLGGKISVESEFGKGTIFTVVLPIRIANDQNAQNFSSDIDKIAKIGPLREIKFNKEKEQNKNSALLLEDDTIASRTGQYILESLGFKVLALQTAEEALRYCKSHKFDIIFSDIGLPGIDGNEFALLYRYWEKKQFQLPIPIIGISAHASTQIKSEAIEAGMNCVLDKPLNKQKINDVLSLLQGNRQFTDPATEIEQNSKTVPDTLGFDLPATEDELFDLESFPLFDELLGSKAAGNKEILRDLITLLVKEMIPLEIIYIESSHKNQDWKSVQKLVHKLKGSALYCGTVRMRYACQYLERYLLAGYRKLSEELYQQLITVVQDTTSFINNHLGLS